MVAVLHKFEDLSIVNKTAYHGGISALGTTFYSYRGLTTRLLSVASASGRKAALAARGRLRTAGGECSPRQTEISFGAWIPKVTRPLWISSTVILTSAPIWIVESGRRESTNIISPPCHFLPTCTIEMPHAAMSNACSNPLLVAKKSDKLRNLTSEGLFGTSSSILLVDAYRFDRAENLRSANRRCLCCTP